MRVTHPRAGAREEHHERQRNHCGWQAGFKCADALRRIGAAAAAARTGADDHLHRDDQRERQAGGLAEQGHEEHRRNHWDWKRAESGAGCHAARHQLRRGVALHARPRGASAQRSREAAAVTQAQRSNAALRPEAARERPYRQHGSDATRHGAPPSADQGRHCGASDS